MTKSVGLNIIVIFILFTVLSECTTIELQSQSQPQPQPQPRSQSLRKSTPLLRATTRYFRPQYVPPLTFAGLEQAAQFHPSFYPSPSPSPTISASRSRLVGQNAATNEATSQVLAETQARLGTRTAKAGTDTQARGFGSSFMNNMKSLFTSERLDYAHGMRRNWIRMLVHRGDMLRRYAPELFPDIPVTNHPDNPPPSLIQDAFSTQVKSGQSSGLSPFDAQSAYPDPKYPLTPTLDGDIMQVSNLRGRGVPPPFQPSGYINKPFFGLNIVDPFQGSRYSGTFANPTNPLNTRGYYPGLTFYPRLPFAEGGAASAGRRPSHLQEYSQFEFQKPPPFAPFTPPPTAGGAAPQIGSSATPPPTSPSSQSPTPNE